MGSLTENLYQRTQVGAPPRFPVIALQPAGLELSFTICKAGGKSIILTALQRTAKCLHCFSKDPAVDIFSGSNIKRM